jgi:hypothetical protein
LSISEDDKNCEWENGKTEVDIEFTSLDECLNIALSLLTSVRANKNIAKWQKEIHLTPIAFGWLQTTLGQPNTTGIKILFDSGSTQSHVRKESVKKLCLRKDVSTTW